MTHSSPTSQTHSKGAGFHCTTSDDVALSGVHVPAGSDAAAFVLAHGFTHGIAKPATRAAIGAFAQHGAVVAADFRGHGMSSGRSSVGRDEVLDLDAVVRWTRQQGYRPVTVVGFSMGGAVALRHAALGDHRPDVVVSVSAPSRWYVRESVPMRRLHWLLEHPLAVPMAAALGVRLGEPWSGPAAPARSRSRRPSTCRCCWCTARRTTTSPRPTRSPCRTRPGRASCGSSPGWGTARPR